ncbi:MAG: hypothetical protein LBI19_07470 [Oscillospiraceae bacterium]|jgi:hypothetical protein|nr:hypothetical protein [Oscillospiraceae bacterium]
MKRAILKRAAALLLAAVFTVAVSACASFADMVTGFADTATYMRGESNIRSETTLSVKLSDNAKPMSFAQLISEAQNAMEDGQAAAEFLLIGLELGFSVVTEIYEDTALVSLGWVGPNGTETLLTLILIDQTIYISTELLGYAGYIDALAEYSGILSLIDCDYIKIDLSTIPGMLEAFTEFDLELEQSADAQAKLQSAMDTLVNVLRDYTPRILTEEYKDILKSEGGGYTLTLNAETTLALLGEVVSMLAEYESDVKAFLLEIGGEFGLEAAMLDDADFGELAREYEKETQDIVIGDDIPDFDLVYKVAGTGSGANKKQTASLSLAVPVDDDEVPFDKIIFECSGVSTVVTQPVGVPSGNVLSLEELMMRIMLNVGNIGL